jgi:acyl-[acyl carrier protein]--UDP-N-acetylglucosamine O-acyltransferase
MEANDVAEVTNEFEDAPLHPSQGGASSTPITIQSVDARLAAVSVDAVVSPLAVVGAPGEWRDRTTTHHAVVMRGATIREFARVHAGCERPTVIGRGVLLMAGSHVGHDAQLGDGCEVAPNAVIGGCCTIGVRVKIGMNASILPHVTVGDGARIGAGSVVNRDVPPGETWVGSPARRIR